MIDQPDIHPSFPQPDDHSQVIWRYMDSDKFEWLLEHGRLFMPTADNLGDPREGSTPPGEIEWWKQEYKNAVTEEQRATVAHNRKFFASFAQKFRPRYYISCWHMNAHENYSMWRCYTKTKRAVAISFRYAQERSGTHNLSALMSAFAITMSLRIKVTTATFGGFPESMRLLYLALRSGL